MTLCLIGAAWRLGGFEIVTNQEKRKKRKTRIQRIYFLFVSGLLNLSGKEKKNKGGLVYFFLKKKKKSLKWICTRVEDNWGFLLFVLGIETKKWRL